MMYEYFMYDVFKEYTHAQMFWKMFDIMPGASHRFTEGRCRPSAVVSLPPLMFSDRASCLKTI